MRTTLTIDDDLMALLQRESKRKGLSFKELVNNALRRGLAESEPISRPHAVTTRPHAFGFKPGFDLDKLNQVADEIEAEAFASRQRTPG